MRSPSLVPTAFRAQLMVTSRRFRSQEPAPKSEPESRSRGGRATVAKGGERCQTLQSHLMLRNAQQAVFGTTPCRPTASSSSSSPRRSRSSSDAFSRPSALPPSPGTRSEEHTSELQSLMRISYAVFCLKKKKNKLSHTHTPT